ncbi:16465_t:CDS:1, partial [Funneliformis geosporum]
LQSINQLNDKNSNQITLYQSQENELSHKRKQKAKRIPNLKEPAPFEPLILSQTNK